VASPIVVVAYDPAWPDVFELIRTQLAAALGDIALAIEHVGSTSVPGLAAKPIIDIDMVIASDTHLPAAIRRLAEIGYIYEGDLGIPGRHAFRPPEGLPKHHPYLCAADNPELKRHLAFRDHLRSNPGAVLAYADLKRDLAERFGFDRDGYSVAKTGFVEEVLRRAAGRSRGECSA
jgi:GrpB-like predicted nucleotidyltransferase (UPF0157 family)